MWGVITSKRKRLQPGWRAVIYLNKQHYTLIVMNLQPLFIKAVFFILTIKTSGEENESSIG